MKYKSDIFKVIHQDAVEMYKIGGITEASLCEYDEMCLKNPKIKKQVSPVYTNNDSTDIKITGHATA